MKEMISRMHLVDTVTLQHTDTLSRLIVT